VERLAYSAGVAALLLMALCLPWWNNGMSIATFALAGVWIVQRITLLLKGNSLKETLGSGIPKSLYAYLALLFALPLIGLTYTENWNYALWDLRIKLPLLILPLALSGLPSYSGGVWRTVMLSFVISCTAAALFSLTLYTGLYNELALSIGLAPRNWTNVRELSPFISHIRLSLFMVIASLTVFYVPVSRTFIRVLFIGLVLIINVSFLLVLQSLTGLAMLLMIGMLVLLQKAWAITSATRQILIIAALAFIPLISFLYARKEFNRYFTVRETATQPLPTYTPRGHVYTHVVENTQLENGYYIWRFIAWTELDSVWQRRSHLSMGGEDARGNPLKGTICRYLTSKGLRKDADGLSSLSDNEIRLIEGGTTSAMDVGKYPWQSRLDQLFFEWDSFRNKSDPSGHSVMQRWYFWQAGWDIWLQQPLLGVGTGDVKDAFDAYYTSTNSLLQFENRHRAHNQWLTIFITYGLFGGWVFLYCWWKILSESLRIDYLTFLTALVCAASFLTEDTLETQAGVALVAALLPMLAMWRTHVRQES
jgi:hypothetical protein